MHWLICKELIAVDRLLSFLKSCGKIIGCGALLYTSNPVKNSNIKATFFLYPFHILPITEYLLVLWIWKFIFQIKCQFISAQ